jgi:hypothetical protein
MTSLDANGTPDRPGAAPPVDVPPDRRLTTLTERSAASPERIVVHQVEQARRQLAQAREHLGASEQRVAELEEAVRNWEEIADEVLRRRR